MVRCPNCGYDNAPEDLLASMSCGYCGKTLPIGEPPPDDTMPTRVICPDRDNPFYPKGQG